LSENEKFDNNQNLKKIEKIKYLKVTIKFYKNESVNYQEKTNKN